jgi:hypothetical protein
MALMLLPTWAIERLAYWTMFALIVLSIERLGKNMNWNIFQIGPVSEKLVTTITLIGIAVLFLWALFH